MSEPLADIQFERPADDQPPSESVIIRVLTHVSPSVVLPRYTTTSQDPEPYNPAEIRIIRRFVHHYALGKFCRGCARHFEGGFLNNDRFCNQCKDKRNIAMCRQKLTRILTRVADPELHTELQGLIPSLEYAVQQ